ncbi:hypothetical protein ABT126_01975 [Streptomyces sp. NPDC002012]|uniref:hypothetical protein n=1 Tax=Streptomyces sp. NPDC002012 TaxID=3154532 RepID=UPI00331EA687
MKSAAVLGAAAALMAGISTSAYAAETTSFKVSYGNSVATGKLTWLNRSVSFSGNNHVASGCRLVNFTAVAPDGSIQGGSSSMLCVGMEADGTRPFAGTLDFSNVVGGPSKVIVSYSVSEDGGFSWRTRDSVTCYRTSGCS